MVRRIFFNTVILLGLNQLVSCSTSENVPEKSPLSHSSVIPSNAAAAPYQLMNIPSASSDLPQPPAASTDRFHYATVLKERNPSVLRNINASMPRYEMKKIPSGLQRYYEEIKGELAWFNREKVSDAVKETRNETLLVLFGHIINDRVKQFHEFESTFQSVFGTGYGNFSVAGRFVLGWLVAFGSAEILRSLDLKTYNVDHSNLDASIRYLIGKHLFSHIANVFMAAPFLIKARLPNDQTILHHIMNKPGMTPIENLAVFFIELSHVHLSWFPALLQILPNGGGQRALTELLAKVQELTTCISTSNVFFRPQQYREKAVRNIKNALQLFLDRCVNDFTGIQQGDRFTVAMLFIETGNVVALERLLKAQPDMLQTLANGKSLLQICMDASAFPCVEVVARLAPHQITQINNGLQSPLAQSIFYRPEHFKFLLPHLKSNDAIPFLGTRFGLTPTTIAMIHGNIEILEQMIQHFDANDIQYDLRIDLEFAMDYLEGQFVKESGCEHVIRYNTLLSHSLWLYLINMPQIANDHPARLNNPLRRTLLDLAVKDRNPVAAGLIIQRFGPQIVNQRCEQGPLQGNCLRFLKNDLNMLRLLVDNGVDINTPMLMPVSIPGDDEQERIESRLTPVLSCLIMVQDKDVIEYVKTLNFNREALEFTLTYARKGFLSTTAGIALELLEKLYPQPK